MKRLTCDYWKSKSITTAMLAACFNDLRPTPAINDGVVSISNVTPSYFLLPTGATSKFSVVGTTNCIKADTASWTLTDCMYSYCIAEVSTDPESTPAGFYVFCWNRIRSQTLWKTGLRFIFGSSRSLLDLYECHCQGKTLMSFGYIAVAGIVWTRVGFSNFEKISDLNPDSQILAQERSRSLKMWFRPSLLYCQVKLVEKILQFSLVVL